MGQITEAVTEEIVYGSVGGSKFRERIDELYKKKKGKPFFRKPKPYFRNGLGKEDLLRAETMIRTLGQSTVNRLAKEAIPNR